MKRTTGCLAVAGVWAVLACVSAAHALTWGELRGQALIGRSFSATVSLQAAASESLDLSCLSAELLHGDVLQAPPALSLLPATPASAGSFRLQLRSAAAVNEPVVTLTLQSTCTAPTRRTYTLLADFPPADLPQAHAVESLDAAGLFKAPGTSNPAAAALPALPAADAQTPPIARATVVAPSRAIAPDPARPPVRTAAQARKPRQDAPPALRPPGRAAGSAPVLRLDPLEVFSDRIDGLDAPMRFDPPADALRQSERLSALQTEVQSLKGLLLKNEAALGDMRAQLRQADDERVPLSWFYALAAAWLGLLLLLAWVLWRQRAAQADTGVWWESQQEPAPEAQSSFDATRLATAPSRWGDSASAPQPASPAPVDLDIDLSVLDAPAASAHLPPAAATNRPPDPTGVVPTPPEPAMSEDAPGPLTGWAAWQSGSVEPVVDLRQQAEFFVSLGQTERAVDLLKKYIADHPQPNPYIYLDLLAVYHAMGMKSEFRACRTSFGRYFNVALPDFNGFQDAGRDLLGYPEVLADLARCWGGDQTLACLNALIFKREPPSGAPGFDLEAFNDLLMLHALAESLSGGETWSATLPRGDTHTLGQPASAAPHDDERPTLPGQPDFAAPYGRVSPPMIDFDLSNKSPL